MDDAPHSFGLGTDAAMIGWQGFGGCTFKWLVQRRRGDAGSDETRPQLAFSYMHDLVHLDVENVHTDFDPHQELLEEAIKCLQR